MTMFYECGYPMRITYLIFLLFTILTLLFLLCLLIKWRCGGRRIALCAVGGVGCFLLHTILLDDHIAPLDAVDWQGNLTPIPIAVLWIGTLAIFLLACITIIRTNQNYLHRVTEENIKEALDEVPMGICYFRKDGVPMLCNRRMQDISEILCDRIFMSHAELCEILEGRGDLRDPGDIFRLPDGTVYRYAEEELVTKEGEHYLVSNFFDITELARRKNELEVQNEEVRKMSAELQLLRENVRLLAKEEEILSIKARWHDVMGEGLTAIRRALLSDQPQEVVDRALQRWSDTVNTIQRDNDDPDQRRDAVGDLLRDAQGLQIRIQMEGALPARNETKQVFLLALRNCLLNAAQHAKATELYAEFTQTEAEDVLAVRNNGNPPAGEVIPRGGLLNVQNHAARIGGRTEIRSVPCFELKVIVPRKG